MNFKGPIKVYFLSVVFRKKKKPPKQEVLQLMFIGIFQGIGCNTT
jgi:hypothetical protein